MKHVPQWCDPFCFYLNDHFPDIIITLETEVVLSCIRVEADLLKLLIVRALSSMYMRYSSSKRAKNMALTVVIRIASIETHIKHRPEDDGRIECDNNGNMRYISVEEKMRAETRAGNGTGDNLPKPASQRHAETRKFFSKRKLVLEVSVQSEEPWIESDQEHDGTDRFLWYALKVVMNQGRVNMGSTAEICTTISEGKYGRKRFLFSLSYQKVPTMLLKERKQAPAPQTRSTSSTLALFRHENCILSTTKTLWSYWVRLIMRQKCNASRRNKKFSWKS